MSNPKLARILDLHSIPHFEKGGRIYADCMESGTALFERTVDVTGWSPLKLRHWLGY